MREVYAHPDHEDHTSLAASVRPIRLRYRLATSIERTRLAHATFCLARPVRPPNSVRRTELALVVCGTQLVNCAVEIVQMTLESAWICEIHHFQLKFVSIYRKEVKFIAITYFLAT